MRNREKARVLVGDRLPVISAVITPSAVSPITTETVSYLDVGLKLDIEPQVHLDSQVAIRINLEVSTASNRRTTANGTTVYDIGTRNASTVLRLADGETQVLMGFIRDDDRRSADKVPGIGDLPMLGRLFSSNVDDRRRARSSCRSRRVSCATCAAPMPRWPNSGRAPRLRSHAADR